MYDNISDEPLDVIRNNECGGLAGLSTRRFRRLFNEIDALKDLARQVADGNFNQASVIAQAQILSDLPVTYKSDGIIRAGTEAVCAQCGEPITFMGSFWSHLGTSPRHPAIPKEGSYAVKEA